MSWKIAGLIGLMLVAKVAVAVNPGDRPVKLSDEQQAIVYVNELLMLTQQISDQYVREVSQNDLLVAGIKGMYEAARMPIPARFEADFRKAKPGWERSRHSNLRQAKFGRPPCLEGNKAILASIGSLSSALDAHCVLAPASYFSRIGEAKQGFGLEFDGQVDFSTPFGGFGGVGNPRLGPAVVTQRVVRSIPFRIVKVEPGSPAQRAGMRPGDAIVQYDGKVITADNAEALSSEMLADLRVRTRRISTDSRSSAKAKRRRLHSAFASSCTNPNRFSAFVVPAAMNGTIGSMNRPKSLTFERRDRSANAGTIGRCTYFTA